jgi:hypothetical protein
MPDIVRRINCHNHGNLPGFLPSRPTPATGKARINMASERNTTAHGAYQPFWMPFPSIVSS